MNDGAFPTGGAAPPLPQDLHVRLPSTPAALPQVRSRLRTFLDAHAIGDDVVDNAVLVAHELAANAIAHGSRGSDEIDVRVDVRNDRLCIVVTDEARRSGAPFSLSPDEQRESGRGLQVVERLAEWSERIVGSRREVRAELPL